MSIEMHRDLLAKAGYDVRFRRDQWVECFASQGPERWRGRGCDEQDAILDVLQQMLPSTLARGLLTQRLSAILPDDRAAVEEATATPAEDAAPTPLEQAAPTPPEEAAAMPMEEAAPPPPEEATPTPLEQAAPTPPEEAAPPTRVSEVDRPPPSDASATVVALGVRWAAAHGGQAAPRGLVVVPERGLFALAEGDSASAVVADALRSAIESAPPLSSSLRRKGVPLLVTAIEQANTAVFNVGRSHPAVRKSGVSLATALVAGQKAVIASLGDSAIYRLRRGALERLAIGAGSGADTAAPKARASVAPRSRGAKPQAPRRPALGQRKALEVETSIVTIQPADTLLLCTPRFRAALPLEEMSAILLRCADPNAAAAELATRAGDAMDGLALVIQVEG